MIATPNSRGSYTFPSTGLGYWPVASSSFTGPEIVERDRSRRTASPDGMHAMVAPICLSGTPGAVANSRAPYAAPVPSFRNVNTRETVPLSSASTMLSSSMRMRAVGRLRQTIHPVAPVKSAVSIPPVAAQSRVVSHSQNAMPRFYGGGAV